MRKYNQLKLQWCKHLLRQNKKNLDYVDSKMLKCIKKYEDKVEKLCYITEKLLKYAVMIKEESMAVKELKCKGCGNEYYDEQVEYKVTKKTTNWFCPNCDHLNRLKNF